MLTQNPLRSPTPITRRALMRASLLGPAILLALWVLLSIVTLIMGQFAQHAHLDPRVLEAIEFLGFASAMTTIFVGISAVPACLLFAVALWLGWGGWLTSILCGATLGFFISLATIATPLAALILIAAGAICGLITWLGARICVPDAFVSKHAP
jgi:magnesium-transporting ATPase (P-type)